MLLIKKQRMMSLIFMTKQAGAAIFQFPLGSSQDRTDQDPFLNDQGLMEGPWEDGSLALDAYPYHIDEPDPLLACEGRNSDAIDSPEAYPHISMVQGGSLGVRAKRRLRLRDLHPMDIVIIAGFLILAAAL
jgi:hypothetical protein